MEETKPYLQVGVKVLLKNPEGKFLFVRRNPKKYPEIGPKWDIVGGRIDIGTSLIENLKREVREEVGLEIANTPWLVGGQDILNVERFPGRHVVRLTYVAETSGTPKIDEESLEFAWFSKDELKTLPENELDQYFKELLDQELL
jgi:ADP-ribose pyrophosphatase YjhB (NUDIX family)